MPYLTDLVTGCAARRSPSRDTASVLVVRHPAVFGEQLARLRGKQHGQILGIVKLLPIPLGHELAELGPGDLCSCSIGVSSMAARSSRSSAGCGSAAVAIAAATATDSSLLCAAMRRAAAPAPGSHSLPSRLAPPLSAARDENP